MLRAYKYRLNPNNVQKEYFEKSFGCARYVYNWALDRKIKAWEGNKTKLSAYDLIKELTLLKKTEGKEWLKDVSITALQQSIICMDSAFQNFFKRKMGYPKFKSKKGSRKSYKENVNIYIDFSVHKIKIPKMNWIKFFNNQTFDGTIRNATISKSPSGKYYVSVLVEDGKELPEKFPVEWDSTVGIDVGIKDFAVLSDGQAYSNPKFYENMEKRLGVLQRRLSRKKKGSNRYEIQKQKVSSYYEKIVNRRTNFIHQVSSRIVRENQSVCIEDLDVKGMMRSPSFAKSISSANWSEFFRQLQYKCDWNGKNLIKIGRYEPSSKTCGCGYVYSGLKLSQRSWVCPVCGTKNDRDLLAAQNIKKFGMKGLDIVKISPMVSGVVDVELSTMVGTVKRQYNKI